jgi:hypothetical protein
LFVSGIVEKVISGFFILVSPQKVDLGKMAKITPHPQGTSMHQMTSIEPVREGKEKSVKR